MSSPPEMSSFVMNLGLNGVKYLVQIGNAAASAAPTSGESSTATSAEGARPSLFEACLFGPNESTTIYAGGSQSVCLNQTLHFHTPIFLDGSSISRANDSSSNSHGGDGGGGRRSTTLSPTNGSDSGGGRGGGSGGCWGDRLRGAAEHRGGKRSLAVVVDGHAEDPTRRRVIRRTESEETLVLPGIRRQQEAAQSSVLQRSSRISQETWDGWELPSDEE